MTKGPASNVQHVNIKIFADKADIDLVDAIPIFHQWIQDRVAPELLIDVADYKHVPDGPGIMLIGHEADYSLDETGGRLGLLYNRKVAVEGNAQAALSQAFDSALSAAKRLETTEPFAGKLHFDWSAAASPATASGSASSAAPPARERTARICIRKILGGPVEAVHGDFNALSEPDLDSAHRGDQGFVDCLAVSAAESAQHPVDLEARRRFPDTDAQARPLLRGEASGDGLEAVLTAR
jgi:hypothetical protein